MSEVRLKKLGEGLEAMGLALDAPTRQRLLAFADLLSKWNKVYNLTSIVRPDEIITLHLLDSLVVLPHLAGYTRLADIGSGGGLPGIPLCIARPDLQILSVEPVNKKFTFQQQARIELQLPNFTPRCARVEDVQADPPVQGILSRAFAELADFVTASDHLLAPDGRFLAMKGGYPEEEIARLPAAYAVERVEELQVPGLDARRHLVIVKRIGSA